MKVVRGILKATNATLNVGIGFKPDFVKVTNGNDLTVITFDSKAISQNPYGVDIATAGDKTDAASAAAGIILYDGEGPLAAASTTELKEDRTDKKGSITKFTIDTAGNKTGHFDAGVDTDVVGVGSTVIFNGERGNRLVAVITALTNDGDATDEVTLNVLPQANLSGMANEVSKIYGMYSFVGAGLGDAVPAGFTIGASAVVNDTDGDVLQFEAGLYDYV